MGCICSILGRDEKYINILVGKPEGKRTLGRSGRRKRDKCRMDFREKAWEAVGRIHLAQDRIQCRAFMNTVMNLQVPYQMGNFLTIWVTFRFTRALLHGISYLVNYWQWVRNINGE
jgi:hypothetical protein